ncbi:MAG TPA: hypothetical protein VHB46_03145 [Burkholderiales bacterium]|nr:hypothetical protein [Burkholderiales bacterium]
MNRNLHVAAFVFVVAIFSAAAWADEHAAHALGKVDFPASCASTVQVDFDRAVALLHHMTYPQAREAFAKIAAADPGCAMAHWGIAMTLFQPLWPTRPDLDTRARGWDEVQKAIALKPPTERERLFIAAAAAFFQEPASNDYWLRIRRWEQAQKQAADAYPDDDEALAFYALAHLAVAPADATARRYSDESAAMLMRVYRHNPDHPGAMHYLVHANDVPGRERESLEITRKYESVAPRNPHALHMPTHIYTRLGDWDGVIRGNLLAADAALEFPAGDRGQYVWDEFPHAIEYLVYADLQKGRDTAAAAQVQRLRETANLEPTFKTAFHQASTQARYALEQRDWVAAAAIVPREPASVDWDRFAWPEAISRFARGLGAAHLGDLDEARAQRAALQRLEDAMAKAGEDLFARNIRMLGLELAAWRAHMEGKYESSIGLMIEASELEASTPKHAVTPGPTLPADEQLGDMLMEQEQAPAALVAYQRALEHYPRRFNSLLGAARAARTVRNDEAARAFYQELLAVAGDGERKPAVLEARSFLAQKR